MVGVECEEAVQRGARGGAHLPDDGEHVLHTAAILTMALPTMALLTMALLTMALPTMALLTIVTALKAYHGSAGREPLCTRQQHRREIDTRRRVEGGCKVALRSAYACYTACMYAPSYFTLPNHSYHFPVKGEDGRPDCAHLEDRRTSA